MHPERNEEAFTCLILFNWWKMYHNIDKVMSSFQLNFEIINDEVFGFCKASEIVSSEDWSSCLNFSSVLICESVLL